MGRIYGDNSESIGNTPLVRLNRIPKGLDCTILAKIEGRNPYSVKCRIGAAMIWAAERDDLLERGSKARTIVEPTSGNTCGAVVAAAVKVAQRPAAKGKVIVAILPDAGERYLSSILFEGING